MLANFMPVAFCLIACVFPQISYAEKLEPHTFQPPFEEVDASGERLVSKHWRHSGTSVVNKNFVRLTPDRQSKKGALWSRKQLGVPAFSTILQFRISGQGKNFFGDGIGFWVSQQPYYMEGDLHGSQEKFTGVGIIFDTFKNTENLAAHRDVTVIANDGTRTYEMMTETVKGCNTNVRYHAERADFSVTDSSRAKIVVEGTKVEVYIDAQNSGDWTHCVTVDDLPLQPHWASKAYLGLTATTGALADNHDVISMKSFSDIAVMEMDEAESKNKNAFSFDDNASMNDKLTKLGDVMDKLMLAQDKMDHELEHHTAAVSDHIKNLLGKLEKREDAAESRITDLEALVRKEVDASLEDRIIHLEKQMKGNVERKMVNIESAMDRKMDRIESKASTISTDSSSSWRLPFFLLFIVIVAAGIAMFMFYQKMKKMHLL